MINFLQPFHHGFFHNGLNIGRTEQFAFDASRLCHPELAVHGYVFFPRKAFCSLKQLFKGFRMEGTYFNQYTFRCTQENIGTAKRFLVAIKCNPAVRYFRYIVSQIYNFFFQNRLHTEMAGRNQFKTSHLFYPSCSPFSISFFCIGGKQKYSHLPEILRRMTASL